MTPTRWQEIKRVYHVALERPPADRAAYLAQVCKDDPELRSEVESLLAQDSSKSGTLDRPAWDGLVSPSDGSMTPITSGTQLGPYKIEGPLGEGGMGEVFRGVDTRLGRSVAVKTSREQFSARFDREARAISALNHPNICTLYDVGPNYLVMELCEGKRSRAHRARQAVDSRNDSVRRADCRCAGSRSRQGNSASRSEAGQRDANESRSESAGFRTGKVVAR